MARFETKDSIHILFPFLTLKIISSPTSARGVYLWYVTDMVNIVLRTGEPTTSFDPKVCNHLFDLIDTDKGGSLTEDEIANCGRNPEVKEFILTCKQPVLKAMLDEAKMHKVFKKIDDNGDGHIDK